MLKNTCPGWGCFTVSVQLDLTGTTNWNWACQKSALKLLYQSLSPSWKVSQVHITLPGLKGIYFVEKRLLLSRVSSAVCYLYLIAWSSNIVQLQGQSISNHNVQLWKESLDFRKFCRSDSGFWTFWANLKKSETSWGWAVPSSAANWNFVELWLTFVVLYWLIWND